jgi:16S rRNA U516 pseudouridylate synthase RsuA-like enzyme
MLSEGKNREIRRILARAGSQGCVAATHRDWSLAAGTNARWRFSTTHFVGS